MRHRGLLGARGNWASQGRLRKGISPIFDRFFFFFWEPEETAWKLRKVRWVAPRPLGPNRLSHLCEPLTRHSLCSLFVQVYA